MKGRKYINIGVLAHVDAGKTTITEQLLHLGGTIKSAGSVDKGSSLTDSLSIEKQRGISVMSASASFEWKGVQVNIIDTPGHIDFCAEVDRCLRVIDLAVVVLSAVEGVQSHTYNIVQALKELGIPIVFFVNKLDRSGADAESVILEIQKELDCKLYLNEDMQEDDYTEIDCCPVEWSSSTFVNDSNIETLADYNNTILECFIEGIAPPLNIVSSTVNELIQNNLLSYLHLGVAKNGIGITGLMDTIVSFSRIANPDKPLSAVVFKIEHHHNLGRLAYVRLFGGCLKVRDLVKNSTQVKEHKIGQLRQKPADKLIAVNELNDGDIGVIIGIPNIQIGDVLGEEALFPHPYQIQQPVIEVQITAKDDTKYAELAAALTQLNSEDPELHFLWYKEEKELLLKLMGNIQMEIIEQIIQDRFGLEVEFSNATVIFKERPLATALGHARYTMPKPCWAVLSLEVKPGPIGSGVKYLSKVGVNKIEKKYQNEIEATVPKSLQQGLKAWNVTDLEITLVDGEDHVMHSRPGDFILATPMAIMDALSKADTELLEPYYSFEILSKEEHLGAIAGELNKVRADIGVPTFDGDNFRLKGKFPVQSSTEFPVKLGMLTSGKAKLKLQLDGYYPCPKEFEVEKVYKGVSPLDRSQWILHHRGAFKVDERKY